MVTQFAFTPTMTTEEMRNTQAIQEKVTEINRIRAEKSIQLVKDGKAALDPYIFDYLLLCNKICGSSHYNMQMKIVVESKEDFKKWLSGKTTFAQNAKAEKEAKEKSETVIDTTLSVVKDSTLVATNK